MEEKVRSHHCAPRDQPLQRSDGQIPIFEITACDLKPSCEPPCLLLRVSALSLINVLGLPINDGGLLSALTKEGIADRPALPHGEYRAYVQCFTAGIELVFTDEAMFLGKSQASIGAGPLYLSGVFVYLESRDGYQPYAAELPDGLTFAKTRDSILAAMGNPSWQRVGGDGNVATEGWELERGCRLRVTYSSGGLIRTLLWSVPDK